MKTTDDFQQAVTRAFDFLVRDYGCTIERSVNYGREAYVSFKCADMTVTVNYELGDEPWVAVKAPGEKSELSLKQWLRRSGIEWKKTSDNTLNGLVLNEAEMLRSWLAATERPFRTTS